jgi:DNA topoisomerase III
MRVIIAEKPSMGRDIAAALGAGIRNQGYIQGKDSIITWCIGHLVELSDPEAYDDNLKTWRLDTLPILPDEFKYQINDKTKDQFKVIKELLNKKEVTSVVNACDAGREGELIFDLVYKLANCKKPVQRLWISSLTKDAIVEGFRNLKPAEQYKGLRASAHARQQSDWIIGLNATRAQTITARRSGHQGVFSLGRVQTPTLALLVERDKEISNFVPTDYYQVVADFLSPSGQYSGTWFNKDVDRFNKKEDAEAVVAKVQDKSGVIESVEKKASREKPPLLYDLTSLQRAANARFGFSAAKTLEVAQSLYEKKVLTYPRTSSRYLSSDVFKEIKDHLEASNFGPYAKYAATILGKEEVKLGSRFVDDKKVTDHHAVIPTKQQVKGSELTDDEKRIFDLVVRRFLAIFYPDAEIERTTIITRVEGETFKTKGSVVLKAGWREIDPPGNIKKAATEGEEEEEADAELPPVQKEQSVKTSNAETLTKQTKAPPRYTEASLLGAMETSGKKIEDEELRAAMKDSGLGTPATRAAIIEVLLQRGYVERDKKALKTTAKAVALMEILNVPVLKSAELTGAWEAKLSKMARNEYLLDTFMGEVKGLAREVVQSISNAQMDTVSIDGQDTQKPDKAISCPKCKQGGRDGFLQERTSANGKFLACSKGKEACGFISDVPKNAKQRKAMVESACPDCGAAMRFRLPKEKGKSAYLSCTRYSDCKGIRWFDSENVLQAPKSALEQGPPCVKCGGKTIKRIAKSGNYFLTCTSWKKDGSGCNAEIVWLNEKSELVATV